MPKKTVKKGTKATKKKVVKKVAKKVTNQKGKGESKNIQSLRLPEVKKPFGKSLIASSIAGRVGLSKKDVVKVIDVLFEVVSVHLKKRGPGEFTLPGIVKFRVVNKPATKSRKGINPFTGQPMVFAAKPARNIVKVKPLKKLKDVAK